MRIDRTVVVGAGVGGLAAAIALSSQGMPTILVDAAPRPGGKMRTALVSGRAIDCGPTVFTMRWVFEELFAQASARLDDHVTLTPLTTLARHAWNETERLDLFADRQRAAEAIGDFAGIVNARGFLAFCAHAKDIHDTLRASFMTAQRPSPAQLVRRAGIAGLLRAGPFTDMWSALGKFFPDPRLQQLFGRYATYCGSSPFLAPATLMLVAHVEQEGVWTVEGGMNRFAHALADLARTNGAELRFNVPVAEIMLDRDGVTGVRLASGETIAATQVICNADASAFPAGMFGRAAALASGVPQPKARSLSAMTFAFSGRAKGFPLHRHNVFFSRDYRQEFAELSHGAMPSDPTIYICAQDRGGEAPADLGGDERLFVLANAPATGDTNDFEQEIARCEERTFARLTRCGLSIEATTSMQTTTPADFNTLFPATGGALYGPATHGAMATFARPAARTKVPGLYLAGGSVHPGPGVPMAALSGRIAAASVMEDLHARAGSASTARSRRTGMRGGMSTR